GLFLNAVHCLKTCEELCGRDGDEGRAVAEKNEHKAALETSEDSEHQHGKSGDDARKNQWQKHKPAEERFAGKVGTIKRERCEQTKRERENDSPCGDNEAVDDRIPDGGIGEELPVPIEGEMARRKAADNVGIE